MAMHEAHVKGPFPIWSLSVDRHRKNEPGTMGTVGLWAESLRKRFSQIRRETVCAGRQLAKTSERAAFKRTKEYEMLLLKPSRSQLSDEPPRGAAGRLLPKLPVIADVSGERVALARPR
jgi:hypothetical protein